jgi:DNA helicase HerA-like ATPase
MSKIIGKISATEKSPTTIDEFCFWTDKNTILSPFDVVVVEHINKSITYGVIEEISHITDAPSHLTSYISNDFGDVNHQLNTNRLGMNYVKAKVIGNNSNIYIPVQDGQPVRIGSENEVIEALGLKNIKNPLPCGYLEMYTKMENPLKIPVHFNSHFLIGPEGAHLNISGISGLASKTSYAMFLMKAIQEKYINMPIEDRTNKNTSVAFVVFNVKGRDLLAIDEPTDEKGFDEKQKKEYEEQKNIYRDLGIEPEPFKNVKYFYPFTDNTNNSDANSFVHKKDVEQQIDLKKAFKYKYLYKKDRENLDLLFASVDDSTGTMDSILNFIISESGNFGKIDTWRTFIDEVGKYTEANSNSKDKEITVTSWRKFKRVINKALSNQIFKSECNEKKSEVHLSTKIKEIKKNEVCVVDIAKLDEDTQGFVFGDVIRAIYDLKLGQTDRPEEEIPSKIIIFIDELNKYASTDVPKNSPILRQIIDVAERGRSLGIILFSAEQFKSAIHERVKGNCATHAYGRTNAIEISKADYRYIPKVYQNMMTRLIQGEYILQNPIFRSLLNIKFPQPLYKQFKNG